MNTTNDCVQDALFLAAHSYSATSFDMDTAGAVDMLCDDLLMTTSQVPEMSAYAFA